MCPWNHSHIAMVIPMTKIAWFLHFLICGIKDNYHVDDLLDVNTYDFFCILFMTQL